MITGRIKAMLEACQEGRPPFPPNVLYNEGWLLRIVFDWFEGHGGDRYPLSILPGARWFSEAWLPSAFLPRYRGDRLAESRTHADGVVGHFAIGDPGTAGLSLDPDARQFVVVEGKLFNRFSAGVRNASYYDQAARSVACIAEALRRADRSPEDLDELGFVLIAPQARVDDGVFAWDLGREAIRGKVRRRVQEYAGERDAWFRDWFEPTLRRVDLRCLAWEEIVDAIAFHSAETGQVVDAFYGECLRFNRPQARSKYPGRRSGTVDAEWIHGHEDAGATPDSSPRPRPHSPASIQRARAAGSASASSTRRPPGASASE